MKLFLDLWNYREMIISLVKRDLKSRYKESVLGFFWMLLNPLFQLIVYTIVFSVIMRAGIEKFYLFLFVALVPWMFFSTCLTAGSSVVLSQQDMIKKIYFPREVLPLSFTISQLVNLLLSFLIIFIVVFFSGVKVNVMAFIMIPVVIAIEFILCLGITLLTSSLTIYFRDLEHILSILSMAWMYLTPILYSVDMVPEKYRVLYNLNPMTGIVISFRDILYYGQFPQLSTLMVALVWAIIVFIVGIIVFRTLQRRFAEEL